LIELEELQNNEQYLVDFLNTQQEMVDFTNDCHSVQDKAANIARENSAHFDDISKLMEEHRALHDEY